MTPIAFRVAGIPQPKGSIQVLPRRRFPFTVRSFRELLAAVIVTADNSHKLKAWEKAIRQGAALVARGRTPHAGPVYLSLVFTFQAPKSDPDRSAHIVRPDLSKLIRGVEDALSGLIFVDDSQIVATLARKDYGAEAGVEIRIAPFTSIRDLFA